MKYSTKTKKGGKRKNKNKSKRRQQHIMSGASGNWYTYKYETNTRDDTKKLFRLCNEGDKCYYIISRDLPDDVEADIKTIWDTLIVRLNTNNKFKDIMLPTEKDELESVQAWGNAPAAVVVPVSSEDETKVDTDPKDAPVSEQVSSNVVKEDAPVSQDVSSNVVKEVAPISSDIAPVVKEVAPVSEEVSPNVVTEVAPVVNEDANPPETNLLDESITETTLVPTRPTTNLLDEPLNESVETPTLAPMISAQETPAPEVQAPEASAKLALEQKPLTGEDKRKEEVNRANELINNAVKEELNKKKNLVNQPAPAEPIAPVTVTVTTGVKKPELPDVFQESDSGPQESTGTPPPPAEQISVNAGPAQSNVSNEPIANPAPLLKIANLPDFSEESVIEERNTGGPLSPLPPPPPPPPIVLPDFEQLQEQNEDAIDIEYNKKSKGLPPPNGGKKRKTKKGKINNKNNKTKKKNNRKYKKQK